MCNICGVLGCGGCLSPFGCGPGPVVGGCVGPACAPPLCAGGGCEPDAECEEKKTVDACTASCSVTLPSPDASRFTTNCYTTRCTDRVACNAVATTTTTRTTSGCPRLPEYQPWYNGNEDAIPTPGDPGWGGFVVATGTYVDPALITPPTDPEDPPAEPEKSVPVPPDGRRPFFAVAYWEEGGKGQYHGFDVYGGQNLNLAWSDMCEFEKIGAVWKYPGDPMIPPGTIRDIPVHKDLCTYTNAKGMTCNKWKDLMCQSVTGGFGSPLFSGKCGGASWGSVMLCYWP